MAKTPSIHATLSPETSSTAIEEACQWLAQGHLVAFPTETVYGLGADAFNPEAIHQIYALKGRPTNHPLIVHIARWEDVDRLTTALPEPLLILAKRFWPGPLTIIAPKSKQVPLETTGGQDSVGIRWPSHPVAQALLQAYPNPIAAPSANRYQHVSPTTAQHVRDDFPDTRSLPFVLDGGASLLGLESTIVGWHTEKNAVTLLRPGHITPHAIRQCLGHNTEIIDASQPDPGASVVSGQEAKHYAPTLPVCLTQTPPETTQWPQAVVLAHAPEAPEWQSTLTQAHTVLTVGSSPQAYAHALYACLRKADAIGQQHRLTQMVIQAVPDTPEWSTIANRLQRVAGAAHN